MINQTHDIPDESEMENLLKMTINSMSKLKNKLCD